MLFTPNAIQEYTQQHNEKIEKAWQTFSAYFHNPIIQENIRKSKEEQYKDDFLRELFVNVFGYIKNPNEGFNLTTEYKNVRDAKKADGAILKDGQVLAVIEIKDTKTTDLRKVETQAFGYKINQRGCTYVITSNFEKLRFYIDNVLDFEEFELFKLTRKEFDLLFMCLDKSNLLYDNPQQLKKDFLEEETKITNELYSIYSDFRKQLFQHIVKRNPQYDKLLLLNKTQKLLDRFLFMCFAEDKHLIEPKTIEKINENWEIVTHEYKVRISLYEHYKTYFTFLNTGTHDKYDTYFGYNGGLFAPDEVLNSLTIDDNKLLKGYTTKIAAYDFDSKVSVDVLGHIFEHSLSEIEEMQAQLEGKTLDNTQSKRKKDGVFYTPKYITKYIVEATLGKRCEEKRQELGILEIEDEDEQHTTSTQTYLENLQEKLLRYREWLFSLTICDPACGSGAFLNQALEFLIAEHHYIDQLETTYFHTTFIDNERENKILKYNLYGVDINTESVEIAKLSLWLRTAKKGRKLSTLNENIKVGNSLINDKSIAGDKAFDWEAEFPHIFEKGGFDVVIGNPPYGAKLTNEIQNYLNEKYIKGGSETVISFLKLSHELLNEKGLLGFIIPKSFSFSSNYSSIREFLLPTVSKIIDCKKVWKDVKLEQVIVYFSKNEIFQHYVSGIRENNTFNELGLIDKKEVERFGFYLNGISAKELQIGKKVLTAGQFLNDIATNSRGGVFQNLITEEGDTIVLGGAEIQRYGIVGIKGKINKQLLKNDEKSFLKPNAVLVQNIVAHIENPTDHIKITACLPFYEDEFVIVDTINQLTVNESYSHKVIWALLNSKLINWYSYLFIFGKAIRTMHFDNAVTSRIPIPSISLEEQQSFITLADHMLELNKTFSEKKERFLRRLAQTLAVLKSSKTLKVTKALEKFYELSFVEFTKELIKQKIELPPKTLDEWESYFEDYKKDLQALQHQLESTDKQIDTLVFDLYGLTEEERTEITN